MVDKEVEVRLNQMEQVISSLVNEVRILTEKFDYLDNKIKVEIG